MRNLDTVSMLSTADACAVAVTGSIPITWKVCAREHTDSPPSAAPCFPMTFPENRQLPTLAVALRPVEVVRCSACRAGRVPATNLTPSRPVYPSSPA